MSSEVSGIDTEACTAASGAAGIDGRPAPVFNTSSKHYYVIECAIKGYFDAVQHRRLVSLLKRRIADKNLIALNLIRQERSSRGSIATKRFHAALDDSYLCSILNGLST